MGTRRTEKDNGWTLGITKKGMIVHKTQEGKCMGKKTTVNILLGEKIFPNIIKNWALNHVVQFLIPDLTIHFCLC